MKLCRSCLQTFFVTLLIMASSPVLVSAQTQFSRTNVPAQLSITATSANVRSGPAISFRKVGLVYNSQIVDCIGKIGGWWIVHLENDVVGSVSGNLAKPYYSPSSPVPSPNPASTPTPILDPSEVDLSADQQQMLDLINQERAKAGVGLLKIDPQLQKMAQVKSDEMVAKSYFSHTSPTYGSPFEMMKTFGISYTSAGENIAGNSSVDNAHEALMNSPGHKENILKSSFNYIGIGITASPTYGKMFAQDFIGR
ncbi:MAG TPA: CAP domain-containing protein [Desulfosporosinus sp.]|nr:CAP domain-containing protein [Desulfosporosinus sp.]